MEREQCFVCEQFLHPASITGSVCNNCLHKEFIANEKRKDSQISYKKVIKECLNKKSEAWF